MHFWQLDFVRDDNQARKIAILCNGALIALLHPHSLDAAYRLVTVHNRTIEATN